MRGGRLEQPAERPRRRYLIALGLGLALVGAAAASRIPVEPGALPGLSALLTGGLDQLELVHLGTLRFDPILARGLVADDVRLRAPGMRLELASLIVRPHWAALLQGRLEPTLEARRFRIEVDAHDLQTAVAQLRELLDGTPWPSTPIRLRRGELATARGERLLAPVELQLAIHGGLPEVRVQAHRRSGGRIDLRAHPIAGGRTTELEAVVDAVRTGDLRVLLARLSGRPPATFADRPIDSRVTGTWHASLGHGRPSLHQVDLRFEGLRPARAVVSQLEDGRFSARASGSFLVHPVWAEVSPATLGSHEAASGSSGLEGWLTLEARFGRVRTLALSELALAASADQPPRLLVSGPVSARVWLKGTVAQPRILAAVSLQETHLSVGGWFLKSTGVPAGLRWMRTEPHAGHLQLDLAGLRARAEWRPELGVQGTSDWLGVDELGRFSPALQAWVQGGSVRAVLEHPPGGRESWKLELAEVELRHRKLPTSIELLSGHGRVLGRDAFQASGLRARIGGTPVTLDVHAERRPAALNLRFRMRTDRMDLAGLEGEGMADATEDSGGLPPELRAAVETPIVLLRRERVHLDRVRLESGVIEAGSVAHSLGTLRDLRVELGFDARRLEVRNLAFHDGDRLHRYRGLVDLNPLVPEVHLAEPQSLPAAPAP